MKQGRRAQKFLFASLMYTCHLRNAELETKHPKYKGRAVLHGHPLAGLFSEKQFEKILLKHGWEKIPNWVSQKRIFPICACG